LGREGQYVSRWGADPIMKGKTPLGPLLIPDVVQGDGESVGTAFMPIPVEGPWSPVTAGNAVKQTATTQSGDVQTGSATKPPKASPAEYLAVALRTFSPLFDPVEELWYVDVALKTDPYPMPRVRLGLVRYQPHAREDFDTPDGGTPTTLRVSTPVAEWIQSLPARIVEVTYQEAKVRSGNGKGVETQTKVFVTVKGPFPLPDQTSEETPVTVDPAKDFEGTRPALEIELIRHQPEAGSRPAVEECTSDIDGRSCVWQTWVPGGPGVASRVDGGWAWTCMFIVPGKLNAEGWRYAISVREIVRGMSANEEQSPGARLVETGPRFLARIELA
jgi:hypothetical protein